MKIKKLILVFCLCTWSLSGFAQNYVDLLNTNTGIVPGVSYEDQEEENPLQVHHLNLLAPIPIYDSLALLVGLNYAYNKIPLGDGNENQTVQMLSTRIGANIKHNQKWSSTYFLLGKFNGDQFSTAQKGFQYGTLMNMRYDFHKRKTIKFGFYLNKDVFGWFTTPIFSFYYKSPNEKFETNLILPIYSRADYKVFKYIRVGADIYTTVRSYELLKGEYANQYIHNAFNEISGYLQFDFLKESLLFKLKGCYAYHQFQLFNDTETVPLGITGQYINDRRSQNNSILNAGWGIRLALTYRYHLD